MQNLQKTWTSDFKTIVNAAPKGHVLAVCLHPALDVTIYIKDGKEISRTETLGGKAINFARMLHALGSEVTLFAPDDCKGQTNALLKDCNFTCELISTNLSLRHNYKYIDADGTTREDNNNAGIISPQDYQQLIHRIIDICRTRHFSYVVLCGSFPQGVEKGVYKYLIQQLSAERIPCIVDTSGEALLLAVQAKPYLIKPNLQEFCDTFAQDISLLKTEKDVLEAVFSCYRNTGVQILCSMDKRGATYAGHEGTYQIKSPVVKQVLSFAGAGDTMLASYVYARMMCNAPEQHALRFACAVATAKVRLAAGTLPTENQIYTEWTQIEIKKGGA